MFKTTGCNGGSACAVRHGRIRPIGCGLEEYVHSCASCHGIAGQGNGPLAEFMTCRSRT
jgi:hypothetical protein